MLLSAVELRLDTTSIAWLISLLAIATLMLFSNGEITEVVVLVIVESSAMKYCGDEVIDEYVRRCNVAKKPSYIGSVKRRSTQNRRSIVIKVHAITCIQSVKNHLSNFLKDRNRE